MSQGDDADVLCLVKHAVHAESWRGLLSGIAIYAAFNWGFCSPGRMQQMTDIASLIDGYNLKQLLL